MSEPWEGKTELRFSWLHLSFRQGHWRYSYRGNMTVDRKWVWDDRKSLEDDSPKPRDKP